MPGPRVDPEGIINTWAIEWTQRDAWTEGGPRGNNKCLGHRVDPEGCLGRERNPEGKREKKTRLVAWWKNTLETLGPIRIGHSVTRLPMAEYWMCIK